MNHQRTGLAHLISNWIVLAQAIENSLESSSGSIKPKLQGVLKKLKDFTFLSMCCLYKLVLDTIAKMSLKFERADLLSFEIMPSVELTIDRIEDVIKEEHPVEKCGIKLISMSLLQSVQKRKKKKEQSSQGSTTWEP